MRKRFRQLHLWMSVPFGLIITIICFSGAALVFDKEIMELCHPDLYYVKKVEAEALSMDKLMEQVSATLPEGISATGVVVSSNPERAWQVRTSKSHHASIYVDQYTGEVKGEGGRTPFFLAMFRLHRWLLDSMKSGGEIFWGRIIVGVSTLMMVFVLITGIIVWWPRTKKVFKNSLKVNCHKGWRRFWYDLHISSGLYTFVLLMVMALTGLTWSFSWYRAGFYKVFGVEVQHGGGHGASAQKGKAGRASGKSRGQRHGRADSEPTHASFARWQQVYDELRVLNPGYKQITVSQGTAAVAFDQLGNQRAADSYTFDSRSGEITSITLYKDAGASGKMRGWIYSVHVGSWGGLFTRILTFIAALAGGMLPLTGYYLWIRRLRRKSKQAS